MVRQWRNGNVTSVVVKCAMFACTAGWHASCAKPRGLEPLPLSPLTFSTASDYEGGGDGDVYRSGSSVKSS